MLRLGERLPAQHLGEQDALDGGHGREVERGQCPRAGRAHPDEPAGRAGRVIDRGRRGRDVWRSGPRQEAEDGGHGLGLQRGSDRSDTIKRGRAIDGYVDCPEGSQAAAVVGRVQPQRTSV